MKDFFCFDIPWGGREIVSRKEKITDPREFPKALFCVAGIFYFLNSGKGLLAV